MKRTLNLMILILGVSLAQAANAKFNIFACEPEWASLAEELGGDRVTVTTATTARQDPHHIQARPSLISKVRRADLLICSGAELEVGWLPMLQRQGGNPKVMTGQRGHFEAAKQVERLEVPKTVDRAMGDVHASGNPHVHLDPRRLLTIAKALSQRMIELDPDNTDFYKSRWDGFAQRWQQAIQAWEQMAEPLKGIRLMVHHQDWAYLFDWLLIVNAGAIEPKPGLPTTASYLAKLKLTLEQNPARAIVHTHYQSPKAARRLSELTGIKVIELPYTVGGGEGVNDLFSLFDETLKRLLELVQ